MVPVFELDFKFNDEILRREYRRLRSERRQPKDYPFFDSNGNHTVGKDPMFDIFGGDKSGTSLYFLEAKRFCENYGIIAPFFVNYLVLKSGSTLGWHIDDVNVSRCCVNHILSDNPTPVSYEDGDYVYKTAVLDVSRKHRVINNQKDRCIFRISFDSKIGYHEMVQLLKGNAV